MSPRYTIDISSTAGPPQEAALDWWRITLEPGTGEAPLTVEGPMPDPDVDEVLNRLARLIYKRQG